MYKNNYIDFDKPLTLYNIFDRGGVPSSELEFALIGGLSTIPWLAGCYTEETIYLKGLDNTTKELRYDYGLVTRDSFKLDKQIVLRLEGNGSQHFWKGGEFTNTFKEQQFNFYQKQINSKIPIININMCITGQGAEKNSLRRKSYVKLVESGILEKSLYMAKTFHQTVNITICDDVCLAPDKCGIAQVDNYITNMILRPNFKLKV